MQSICSAASGSYTRSPVGIDSIRALAKGRRLLQDMDMVRASQRSCLKFPMGPVCDDAPMQVDLAGPPSFGLHSFG
jgi:hypothetical protein